MFEQRKERKKHEVQQTRSFWLSLVRRMAVSQVRGSDAEVDDDDDDDEIMQVN